MQTPRFFRHRIPQGSFLSRLIGVALLAGAMPSHATNQMKVSSVDGGMPYWLHVPPDAALNPGKRYATIIYLHGWGGQCPVGGYGKTDYLGDIANEGPQQYTTGASTPGLGFMVNGQMEYFVIITPQIKEGKPWNAADIVALLDEVKTIAPVDENRVYLTGFSFGGEGTWNVLVEAANQPNRFAGAAPAHGRAENPVRQSMQTIADRNVPVWALAGTNDTTEHDMYFMNISVQRLLEKRPIAEVSISVHENVGHSSGPSFNTGHTYHNPNMYEWFLSKTLQPSTPVTQTNLARPSAGATVTAGSTQTNANRVSDGNLNSFWVSTSTDPSTTWLQYDLGAFKTVGQFVIHHAASTQLRAMKPTPASGNVTAFADGGGGTTIVTASNHGFQNGEPVRIANNVDYDGSYTVAERTTHTFKITKAFVGTGAANWQVACYTTKAYTIETSPDGQAPWTPIVTVTNNYAYITQHIIPPTSMRYVRLHIQDGTRMTLASETRIAEFEVMEAQEPVDPPSAPANLQVSNVTSGGATLEWEDTSDNESQFRLYWSTADVKPASPNTTVTANATSFVVSGLNAATPYYFWVSAYNSGGESAAVDASGQTLAPSPPVAPTGLSASGISPGGLTLLWTDVADNETGYKVYWNTTNTQPGLPGATIGAGSTNHYVSGLNSETTYYFWVTAYNAAGETAPATTSAATTQGIGSIETGLLSHWRFEEGTGITAIDSMGLQSGTLQGNTAWLPAGKLGGALQFDGTDDWVEVPHKAEYSGGALSISLWLKPEPLGGVVRGIIAKRTGTASNQRCFGIFTNEGSNKIFIDIATQRTDMMYTLPANNAWHHMVVTFDGTQATDNLKLYMDGVLVVTKTTSATSIPALNGPLCIGSLAPNYGTSFPGAIDHVRLHNRVLSTGEVGLLFGETQPEPEEPASFESWAAEHLSSVPAEQRDATADPDFDGIFNVMEFALSLSPLESDAHLLPQTIVTEEGGQTYLEMLYSRRTDAVEAGLTYRVTVSQDLMAWPIEQEGAPLAEEVETTDNGDGTETVRVRCIHPLEETGAAFMRLQVETAEP